MIIRFTDAVVKSGNSTWNVTGFATYGMVRLTRIEGDITNPEGLHEAMVKHFRSRPRYNRYLTLENNT